MMKRKFLIHLLFLVMTIPLSAADQKQGGVGVGLGIFLGSPVAFTFTAQLKGPSMVQCGMGVTQGDNLYLYADYRYRIYTLPAVKELSFFIGGGAAYNNYDHDSKHNIDEDEENRMELRVPLGMDFAIPTVPVVVTLELTPALQVVPDADFHMRGGVGVKYFF